MSLDRLRRKFRLYCRCWSLKRHRANRGTTTKLTRLLAKCSGNPDQENAQMIMIYRNQAILAGIFALVFFGCDPASADSRATRPNIVIFLVDDMGIMDSSVAYLADKTGAAQRYPLNEYYRTPHMERLAAKGIRFNNFCAMNVCSPTRISILTGQNAARHRTTNWIHSLQNNCGTLGPPDWNWDGPNSQSVTLPRLLRQAGYRTIHVGKAHFGQGNAEGADPLNLGFEVNVAGGPMGHPASYYAKAAFGNGAKPNRNAVPHLEKYHGSETFLSEALTIEAMTHVTDSVTADKPFFLHLAHYAVHSPFQSDPRFAESYTDSDKSAKAQAFATLIEGVDKSLGDLLSTLQTLNVADNTLIFFLGDNGSDAPLGGAYDVASSAPLRGKKATHYEGGMRTPFIAAWAHPNEQHSLQQSLPIPSNAIHGQIAAVHDLFPTIAKVAGVAIPDEHIVDGQDLSRMLLGQQDPTRDNFFLMHYPHEHRSRYFTSLRSGDWKVVYHYFPSDLSGGSHYELFNLAADPFESNDLATSKPRELRRMMIEMVERLTEHRALYPIESKNSTKRLQPIIPASPTTKS